MTFVDIITGQPFNGVIPREVELPVHKEKPVPHSILVKARQGDPDWPEALERYMWFEGYMVADKVRLKHLSGQHDQKSHGRGGSSTSKVWGGKPVQWDGKKLTKNQTGELGEQLAMKVLQEHTGAEFRTLNEGVNNSPIDVGGDHLAVEVKTGLASNGPSAQKWRATIGQPGKAEAALLKQMTPEEKRTHNQYKQEQILQRKTDMLAEMSQIAGAPVKGMTVGVILHPDGSRGDVYRFEGFHSIIRWGKADQMGEYLGTYEVGE